MSVELTDGASFGKGNEFFPDGIDIVTPGIYEGAGMGVTYLEFPTRGINIRKQWRGCVTLRNLTITTPRADADFGIRCVEDVLFGGNRGGSSELILENVEIRPAPGLELSARFTSPIVLDRVTCPKLSNIWVQGRFTDYSAAALELGGTPIAIDLGGCQEAKLDNLYISGAKTGVEVRAGLQGEGEGFSLSESAIINCLEPVRVIGTPAASPAGFPMPWVTIHDNHFFYLRYGAFLHNVCGANIHDNDFCRSHLANELTVGVYGVTCQNTKVRGNTFWNTGARPDSYSGIFDASTRGVIDGNIVDPSMMHPFLLVNANGPTTGFRGDNL